MVWVQSLADVAGRNVCLLWIWWIELVALWVPQAKCRLVPLYLREGRQLSVWYCQIWAPHTKTVQGRTVPIHILFLIFSMMFFFLSRLDSKPSRLYLCSLLCLSLVSISCWSPDSWCMISTKITIFIYCICSLSDPAAGRLCDPGRRGISSHVQPRRVHKPGELPLTIHPPLRDHERLAYPPVILQMISKRS